MKDQKFNSLREITNRLLLSVKELISALRCDLDRGLLLLLCPPGFKEAYEQSLSGKSAVVQIFSFPAGINRAGFEVSDEAFQRLFRFKADECLQYLERIISRLADNTCRILVTGDINSGKSTFINALLRQNILPVDEQPCTQCFCEVLPIAPENVDRPVRVLTSCEGKVAISDEIGISEFRRQIIEDESPHRMYQIFVPQNKEGFVGSSSLDVSIIDSPGLNCDLMKTMSLFAKQEDIDVIIFVIDSANHLTLSAREFLQIVGREKLHIFIVVNKVDAITNVEKCESSILRQIRELLPQTFLDRSNLIHFISAEKFIRLDQVYSLDHDFTSPGVKKRNFKGDFLGLEARLKEFVFDNKAKSKYLPSCNYICNVLGELTDILSFNIKARNDELMQLNAELAIIKPCYDNLASQRDFIRNDISAICVDISEEFKMMCIAKIGALKSAPFITSVPWLGFLNIPSFLKSAHERMVNEHNFRISSLRIELSSAASEGLGRLRAYALENAKHVYSDSDFVFPNELCFDLNAPSPCEFGASVLWAPLAKKLAWWLFAVVSGGSLSFRAVWYPLTRIFSIGKKSNLYLATGIVSAGFAVVYLYTNIERTVRGHLIDHYEKFYGNLRASGNFGMDNKLNRLQDAMNLIQTRLLDKYEAAFERQRVIHSGKEIQKARLMASIRHLDQNLKMATELNEAAHCLKIQF